MRGKARDDFTETRTALDLEAEGPLRRWARRRREVAREEQVREEQAREGRTGARRAPAEAPSDLLDKGGEAGASHHEAPLPAVVEEKVLTDEDMPALDSLGEDSDYSGFLSPGVSEGLRRRALRKLFSSAVFNVPDGLDDYDDDFTTFAALGDIVTSDMKHQAEMEAERAKQARAGTEPAAGTDDTEPTAGIEDEAHRVEGDASDGGPQARTSAEVESAGLEDGARRAEDDRGVPAESAEPVTPAVGETTGLGDLVERSSAETTPPVGSPMPAGVEPLEAVPERPAAGETTGLGDLVERSPAETTPLAGSPIPAGTEPPEAVAREDASEGTEGPERGRPESGHGQPESGRGRPEPGHGRTDTGEKDHG